MEQNPLETAKMRSQLIRTIESAKKALLHGKGDHKIILSLHEQYMSATKALEDFENNLLEPEEIEFRDKLKAVDEAMASLKLDKEKLIEGFYALFPDKKPQTKTPSKSVKTTYEEAQEMRRKLAPKEILDVKTGLHGEGMTNKELGESMGFTKEEGYGNGFISPIKNYKTHQLKEGDFAWL